MEWDTDKRPQVSEVLQLPFLKSQMENFIVKKGFLSSGVAISSDSDPFAGLTPSQWLKKKKELKALEEAE